MSCNDSEAAGLGIYVRPVREHELKKIVVIFSEIIKAVKYYGRLAKKNEIRKYTVEKLRFKISNDPQSVLVALTPAGQIVGFCFNHFDDFTIWIDWLGVAPSSRRRGVGKALLEATFGSARKRSCHKVWCDTRSTNVPSKLLLKRVGFTRIAEIKDHWYRQNFILWQRSV